MAGALDIDLGLQQGFADHLSRYDRWLDAGFAGEMGYLSRGRDRRADPRLLLPEAQSILCVGLPYSSVAPGGAETDPKYARYLKGRDYHHRIAEMLEAVMERVSEARLLESLPAPRWKVCVDTSAVLERSWAALAGLGWIGKNTLLIHPQHGSYFFIGEVLIDLPTGQGPSLVADYCGSCNRCLGACPTQAFTAPHELDSRKCVSYATLEKRGDLGWSEENVRGIGTRLAGCDACQEACPFNTKSVRREASVTTHSETTPDLLVEWISLLTEKPEEYQERVRFSSLKRVKPAQFRRNLAIALGNALLSPNFIAPKTLGESLNTARLAETDLAAASAWERALKIWDTEILT